VNLDSASCKLLFNDPIQTESAGILLRSRLQSVARRMGFSDPRRENMALVASELVTNLIKYAGGRGALQIWEQPDNSLDLVSFDYGPGMDDIPLAQKDGYSTKGTLGKGLGSMQRLSDQFAIYSHRNEGRVSDQWHGTAVWCRFRLKGAADGHARDHKAPWEAGMFVRSLANDRYNGDHIYLDVHGAQIRLLHLDGLGHGESAQLATIGLDKYVTQAEGLGQLVETVDRHLRTTTRGAVAIACDVDLSSRTLHMLGVGDMGTHLCQCGHVQHFSFSPGVLGHEHKTPQVIEAKLEPGTTLVSTSDGIRRGWNEDSFPGLFNHHPQMVAYVIGNSMARMTDDQSICAIRLN
jgi:anti-sigma regulatory factor (Ser/Thr protein kinase)